MIKKTNDDSIAFDQASNKIENLKNASLWDSFRERPFNRVPNVNTKPEIKAKIMAAKPAQINDEIVFFMQLNYFNYVEFAKFSVIILGRFLLNQSLLVRMIV